MASGPVALTASGNIGNLTTKIKEGEFSCNFLKLGNSKQKQLG